MSTTSLVTKQQWVALAEIFLIIILPIMLIQTGVLPKTTRIQLYSSLYGLTIPLIFIHRLSLHDLGLRVDNFWIAARLFGVEAIIIVIGGFLAAFVFEYRIQTGVARVVNPLQYVLVSVPIQQFVFFGFLYNRLTVITDIKWVIALTIAILFSASHLPWDNKQFVMVTAVMGLAWSSIYVFTPNLIWTCALHAIVGLFSLIIVQLN